MARGAKHELRKYASELAVGIASERIRARMDSGVQTNLVNGFLADIERRAAARTN